MSSGLLLEVITELGCGVVKGGGKRGRCSYASSSQHACAIWKSECVAPAVDCPMCHCTLGAVAKFLYRVADGNQKDKTRAH